MVKLAHDFVKMPRTEQSRTEQLAHDFVNMIRWGKNSEAAVKNRADTALCTVKIVMCVVCTVCCSV